MKKPLLSAAVALVVLGLVGAVTYRFFWDPDPDFDHPAPNEAANLVTPEQLAAVAGQRIYFGHKSVGSNIISGLGDLAKAHGVDDLTILETQIGEVPQLATGSGAFIHTAIGENRHPYRKLENFEATLRGGMAEQVDTAMIKFCYIDIRWDTDVDKLFNTYTATMERLAGDYPEVRFIHVTAPLTTGPYGIKDHLKLWMGRDDNATRERYNEMLRAAYGPEELLDVAAVEATSPDGVRGAELYSGYSSDGAHLNATGSGLVAAELVRLLTEAKG